MNWRPYKWRLLWSLSLVKKNQPSSIFQSDGLTQNFTSSNQVRTMLSTLRLYGCSTFFVDLISLVQGWSLVQTNYQWIEEATLW